MTTEKGMQTDVAEAAVSATEAAVSAPPVALRLGRALLMKVKRKAKRRYSSRFASIQKRMRGFARLNDTVADAIAVGVATYRKRSEASALDKKDGALKNLWKDSSKGIKKTLKKSSKVPSAFVKAVRPDRITRAVLRRFSR